MKIFDLFKSIIDKHLVAFAALVYVVLGAIKMRHYLTHGRFWAEEGAVFYSNLSNKDLFGSVLYLFNGHLELSTNIVVYLSTFVSLIFAPLVTTYVSLAVQMIPILIIAKYRKQLFLSTRCVLIILVVAVGLPQASEVWANAINLHFHFSLVVALIAAIKIDDGPQKWISRVLLVLSGLSGIPPNFLVPVFAFLAIRDKQRERWIQFSILTVTTLIQIGLLAMHGLEAGNRSYFSVPLAIWLAPVAQSVASPLFGFGVGDQVAAILRESLGFTLGPFLFSAVFTIPLVFFAVMAFKEKFNSIGILILSAFVLLVFSVITALGDKLYLISAGAGGRYFYAPNILFAISILALSKYRKIYIMLPIFLLFVSSVNNIKHYIGGPDWINSYNSAAGNNDVVYDIWPSGWKMILKNNR